MACAFPQTFWKLSAQQLNSFCPRLSCHRQTVNMLMLLQERGESKGLFEKEIQRGYTRNARSHARSSLVGKREQMPASGPQALDVGTEGSHLGFVSPRPLALLEKQLEIEAVLQAPSFLLANLLPALLLLLWADIRQALPCDADLRNSASRATMPKGMHVWWS